MSEPPQELWAYVADGEDSICAAILPGIGNVPMVFAKRRMLEQFREVMMEAGTAAGKTIRVVRFVRAEMLEEIT